MDYITAAIFSPETKFIFAACLIDLLIGDPRWLPHPVVYTGRMISLLEKWLNRGASPLVRKLKGLIVAVIVPSLVFSLVYFPGESEFIQNTSIGYLILLFLAASSIAARELSESGKRVWIYLLKGDLEKAREALSCIVGRDTKDLSEKEIVRGSVESIAENTSDGIIAPLFYLIIGGPPLALAYKAVNTLDSMIGHKNERYGDFGMFSARLDDLLNFVPARISGFLFCVAALFLRLDWGRAFRTMWRDARKHPSPNAGFPESAVAGAIGIQLGGRNSYEGIPQTRPSLGEEIKPLDPDDIRVTVKMMFLTYLLLLALMIIVRILLLFLMEKYRLPGILL